MRSVLLVVVLLAIAVVHAQPAEACCAVPGSGACGYGEYELHVTDPEHADDSTPPSAPVVEVEVIRFDQGCESNGLDLVLDMQATDDRTEESRIGFIVTVARGDFEVDIEGGAAINPLGSISVYFREEELPFEGELEIRAADTNGNIGPPTFVEVSSNAPTSNRRFASFGGAGPLLSYGLVGLALVIARRRRRR